MLASINSWLNHVFADKEAVALTTILVSIALIITLAGSVLQPVLISVVLAYLLYWLANALCLRGVPYNLSVLIVYTLFLGAFLASVLVLLPLVWQQFGLLFEEFPNMMLNVQQFLYLIPEQFPDYLTRADIDGLAVDLVRTLRSAGREMLSASIASIPSIIAILVYMVLVPLMVFFFLKDKVQIMNWISSFLPQERRLLYRVWTEVDRQLGNYIRGKVVEMIIVFLATYAGFLVFGLKYGMLLAFLVGLSVAVPYVGAIIVTIPIVFVALFQWGLSSDTFWLLLTYTIIQAVDGNLLVPVLFSEAVSLHPVAIIIAIILFGGLWGVWGVFFAIPLAILARAVVYSWPMATRS